MDATQKIPPYRQRALQKNKPDVVAKELHHQEKWLKTARERNRKLKSKCADQKRRRKQAEQHLKQEQTNAVKREMYIRLRTKLDDLAFYHEDTRKEVSLQ